MAEMIATRDAYGDALVELGKENNDIVVLDADLSAATKTSVFKKAFPDRHINCGIAEMNMGGVAAGLASCGKIPFISTFAMFGTGRIYDLVRNLICYPKLNVKLAMTHAGLTVGEDGATHQALEDVALMNALPNMTVLVPADSTETKQAIFAAAKMNGPVYIRLGRAKTDVIYDETYKFEIGKANTLCDGEDVAIFANGIMLAKALAAAEELKKEGVNASVINVATVKPLDENKIVEYAKKCRAVVVCEEHSIYGGLHSVICKTLSENAPTPVEAVCVNDTFGESGTPDELLAKYKLTTKEIVAKAKKAISRK